MELAATLTICAQYFFQTHLHSGPYTLGFATLCLANWWSYTWVMWISRIWFGVWYGLVCYVVPYCAVRYTSSCMLFSFIRKRWRNIFHKITSFFMKNKWLKCLSLLTESNKNDNWTCHLSKWQKWTLLYHTFKIMSHLQLYFIFELATIWCGLLF